MSDGLIDGPAGADEAAEAAGDALVGTVIAERYRIDQLLGVGGMGAVYRAEHVLMKKPVAVKVLHREMTLLDEVVKRFEREAIAAGRIDHPNVTVATDFGKLPEGAFYLVLEYVPGRSLTRAIEEDGAFPEQRALFVARQIAAALSAAHAAGIVHRDLKPDNVMLIERGGTPDFVKVLDFGIAKVETSGPANSKLTQLGAVFGTPQYMAPEQAAGKSVDGRADLYSLGLVLHEMLAGTPAFDAPELVQLLAKQLTEPPPDLPASVGPETASIVKKLLEKDPAVRFQSAAEVVAIIEEILGPAALPPDSSVLGASSSRSTTLGDREARAPTAFLSVGARTTPGARTAANLLLSGPTIDVAGRVVPVRLASALGAALIVTVVLASHFHGRKSAAPSIGTIPAPPELSEVIARAENGDPAALTELEARAEGKRTPPEWVAIGKARSRTGQNRRAMEAFAQALALDAALAKDPAILHDVRIAADDDKSERLALDLAAGSLGEGGADLLFDVWTSTNERTDATTLAKSLLDRDNVRAKASPPLRVALELRRVSRCDDAKRLVTEAASVADERAVRPLTRLSTKKGCGFLGLGDCFSCLRGDDSLSEAMKAAQLRKAPRL